MLVGMTAAVATLAKTKGEARTLCLGGMLRDNHLPEIGRPLPEGRNPAASEDVGAPVEVSSSAESSRWSGYTICSFG